MNQEFVKKMKSVLEKTLDAIIDFYKYEAIEAHIFGSMARGTNDALSDIDIWLTFEDSKIQKIIEDRMVSYATFGEIVLLHEMQNNFPLKGIQTAVIYKIDGELIRVDFYLCPLSSSRILPESKVLFEKQKVEMGNIIPETQTTPRDLSDRITFFISMCFNGIKKVVRRDESFAKFLVTEFQKYKKEIPELSTIPAEPDFDMLRKSLAILDMVSNSKQKHAIVEIETFMTKIEGYLLPVP
ncbi:MAG: nucleotidyltransferase domain-containing protein [bacterium]|nr:nucleotidyltransferase domain-containing protein [bacterium]